MPLKDFPIGNQGAVQLAWGKRLYFSRPCQLLLGYSELQSPPVGLRNFGQRRNSMFLSLNMDMINVATIDAYDITCNTYPKTLPKA